MYISTKLKPSDIIPSETLAELNDNRAQLTFKPNFIHLQFRRFAGCPICNLHLHSFTKSYKQLQQIGVREVVVFPSSKEQLEKYANEFPFKMIGDPSKTLYRMFGVEEAANSLINPKAWPGILKGITRSLWEFIAKGKPLPPIRPSIGGLGLPADFLILPEGTIVACKYGEHADDQWAVHEMISLVNTYKINTSCKAIQSS